MVCQDFKKMGRKNLFENYFFGGSDLQGISVRDRFLIYILFHKKIKILPLWRQKVEYTIGR